MTPGRRRLLVAAVAALLVLGPLGYLWQASLMPGTYSVMDMGYLDYGGGPAGPSHQHGAAGHGVSVAELVADPDREADVVVDLVVRKERFDLAGGQTYDGYTVNGQSPGPLITATLGELVEVRLRNESVPDGITLHWHGVDVPNGMDGVAGVTQNAVGQGQEFVYRFVADQIGSYWYHSHQVSHRQVIRGLFGPLVVLPQGGLGDVVDVPVVAHTYAGIRTLNGRPGATNIAAEAGSVVRVRVINTDNGPLQAWSDAPYVVRAIDGQEVNEPTVVADRYLTVTAGGRADLEVVVPATGSAQVQIGGSTQVVLGASAAVTTVPRPDAALDLLAYGTPVPLPFDAATPDRQFRYAIGRKPGFVDGKPGLWWSINGRLFPDVPMYVVREGEVAVFRIENHSGEVHPMHLHGHHAVVLSRDGVAATGSPWWVDSLDVKDGETFEIAFVADNPGVWMDHCHNLNHAAQGLIAHLMYEGVTVPYVVGGEHHNEPE